MKRTKIELTEIAAYGNLVTAAVTAAQAKHTRPDVRDFFSKFDKSIDDIRKQLVQYKAPYGIYKRFTIHDPKKRIIHAACFEDRVIHHAIMHYMEPVIDRELLPTVFACRKGKGTLQAVQWVQQCIRRYPWYVKIDIRKYFDSIDHNILISLLKRKLKGRDFIDLLTAIIDSYHVTPGKGIPIGALTSQYFANYYLKVLDRFLFDTLHVSAHARYMDDIIWWCPDRLSARTALKAVIDFLQAQCLLTVKDNRQINRSSRGISFCGFRILSGMLKLSRRRKKRYSTRKKFWEKAYSTGLIDAVKLQNAYAAVHAITLHAESREWRRQYLARCESIDI